MPTPERTSLEEILGAARDLLETQGPARLTMQAVADRVGVRAPSLYKRVRSRDDLILLVAEATVDDLSQQLRAVAVTPDPREDLGAIARAFRAFAHARPAGYHLIWGPAASALGPDALARASEPVLRVAADLAGPRHALEAARMITAWATGFISMELAGAFNLGGDVELAYEFGIARLTEALSGPGQPDRNDHPSTGDGVRA
jgi:AcrR family transcriptional regulator